ncbi:cell wall-binding protein [Bacillus subtilis]
MKQGKFSLFLTLLLMLTLVAMPKEKAEAASSGWQPVSGISGCKIRVITDAYTYTKRATSIDAYAETNGKCGKLYYNDFGISIVEGGPIGHHYSGYFSNRTPTKKFYFSKLPKPTGVSWSVGLSVHKGKAYDAASVYINPQRR